MELMNCRNCKKLFNYVTGEKICPKCKEELEEKFQVVKEYIRDNPGANVDQVADECEVTVKQIKKWVREARLTFADDSLIGLECERCGRMIHCGRFCTQCAGGLEEAMNGMFKQEIQLKGKPQSGGKMRFLE
ncbi:MAG: flagellar protein [Lachnospiraceae bacterium]|nr:flagellar protein [Lachnospiraceae bacterium]